MQTCKYDERAVQKAPHSADAVMQKEIMCADFWGKELATPVPGRWVMPWCPSASSAAADARCKVCESMG